MSSKKGELFIPNYSIHVFAKLLLYEDPFKPYKTKHEAAPFCGFSLFMSILLLLSFLRWITITTLF